MSTEKDDVAEFLKHAKALIADGSVVVVRRRINLQDIAEIGLTIGGCKQELLSLSTEHYSSGPEPDHDFPGDVWVFGKDILDHEVYIKLKIDSTERARQLTCISFHIAKHPMDFPFKTA